MDHTFTHSQPNIELKPTKAHNPLPNLTLIHSPRLSREQPRAASASPPPLSLSLFLSHPPPPAACKWSSPPPGRRLLELRRLPARRRPCSQAPADGAASSPCGQALRPANGAVAAPPLRPGSSGRRTERFLFVCISSRLPWTTAHLCLVAAGRRTGQVWVVDPCRPRPANWGDEPGSRNAGSTPNYVTMCRTPGKI